MTTTLAAPNPAPHVEGASDTIADVRVPAPGPAFTPLQTPDALRALRDDAEAGYQAAKAAAGRIAKKLAAVDAELRPEIRARREAEIRDAEDPALLAGVRVAREASAKAVAQRRHYTKLAVLRRTRVHGAEKPGSDPALDAALKASYAAVVEQTHPTSLPDLLEDAAAAGNLALVEAVRRVIAAKAGIFDAAQTGRINAVMEQLEVPESAAGLRTINEAESLADHAEMVYAETRTGKRPDAVAKLSLSRRDKARGLPEGFPGAP